MSNQAELIKKIDYLTHLLAPKPVNEAMKQASITHKQRVEKYQRIIKLSTIKK